MTKFFFQKWQCVEDASGKLKLHKCKGMANLAAAGNSKGTSNILPKYYNRNSEDCNCEENEYKLSHVGRRKKLFSKKSKRIHCTFCLCLRRLLLVCSLTHKSPWFSWALNSISIFTVHLTVKQRALYWTIRFENVSVCGKRSVLIQNRVLYLCLSKLGNAVHTLKWQVAYPYVGHETQCFTANTPVFSRYCNAWSRHCSHLFLIRMRVLCYRSCLLLTSFPCAQSAETRLTFNQRSHPTGMTLFLVSLAQIRCFFRKPIPLALY